jgi:hypothetical protein
MPKKKTNNLQPNSSLEQQATARYLQNRAASRPRDFRDAITKVTGGIRGIPTQAAQWDRWDK